MSRFRTGFFVLFTFLFVSLYASAQCIPATSPAAKICSPVSGSTVTSPVHLVIGIADSHKITEINTYVDNVSVYKTTTASSVDTTVAIAPGMHTLRIQVWDSTGTIYRDSVSVTVSGSGPPPPACAPATDPGAKICNPVNGGTITSPVHLIVATKDTAHKITEINTYVDNVAVNKTAGAQVDTTVTVAAGTHNMRVQAWDTTGTIYRDSVTITVSSGPPIIAVTVTPSSATVATNGTQQFSASVTNNSNASVTWSVDGVAGGNSTTGTVSAAGLYTAPASAGSHTVTATSAADTTKSGPAAVTVTAPPSSVTVSPKHTQVTPEQTAQFTANTSVNWSVDGVAGGNATMGTISSSGLYTPPSSAGSHQITATSTADSTKSGNAAVYVTAYAGTMTYHNDNGRTGQNTAETVLTPSNVNSADFGKLFSRTVDGFVFAQPLYVRNVNIGGARNVVYVATENASVYAFDADGNSSSPLWKRSFINPSTGINPVTNTDVGNSDLGPQAGITSTPVIDISSGTMYVLVRTNENGAYFQRLHAISLTSGADSQAAAVVSATVNGSGVGGDGAGHINFDPKVENQRASLLLANGNIYIAWASHGDNGAYHGWIMAYNASSLSQVGVLNLTPNGKDGGIWMGGAGPAADASGNVFVATGNGTNDVTGAALDFGDTYLKLNALVAPLDYFTPFDQSALNSGDLDLGSSGVVLLPDQSGTHPHVMIGSGKRGDVYVIDRDAMGGFHAGSNTNAVQYLSRAVGLNSVPDQFFGIGSYWNGNVYFAGSFDHLKQFSISGGLLSTSAVHTSPQVLASDRAAEPVISSNGTADGIVWVIATDTYTSNTAPAVLHAYDAMNVSAELYNNAQAGSRDTGGKVVKFTTPTVANGRVYVGTRNSLDVYGLLP